MTHTFVSTLITVGVALFVFGLALSLWSAPAAFMVTGALLAICGVAVSWYSTIEHEAPTSTDVR